MADQHETEGTTTTVDAVVVGAGFSGLYAIHRLRQDGFTARAFETAESVGGTWFWNRYPGARCDVESIDYQYSFSPELVAEWRWSERYPAQAEILNYLNHVADRFDLRRDLTLNTTVTSADWDDDASVWVVGTDNGEQVTARWLVMASGILSTPKDPDVPGVAQFTGLKLHTATWPRDGVDLTGKRVAVVGTGSTAIQTIPELAEQAEHLLVLQRTPNFALPAIMDPVSEEEAARRREEFAERRAGARRSFLGLTSPLNTACATSVSVDERNRTFEEYYAMGGLPMYGAFIDLLFVPEANRTISEFVGEKIRARVSDKAIADLLVPTTYPWGTKRVCVERGYFETYNRDDVTLIDISATPIEEVTATGVRIAGTEHPVDVLVFATGFDAMTGAFLKINPRGRGGRALSEEWRDGPRTYLGLTVAGFPNMFLVTGPGSPAPFSNVIVSIEQHVDWLADAMVAMRERDIPELEATTDAQDDWTTTVGNIAAVSLFPQAQSWYMGANVPGKPRVFLAYLGGVGPYRQICDDVAAGGYAGFTIGPPTTMPAARIVPVATGVELEVVDTASPSPRVGRHDTESGPPLVLVCGTSHDLRLLGALIPVLARSRRVIAYNHRGIGASTRDASPISVASLAGDLAALLDALEISRADVVGWSLGSCVAQELALAAPDKVNSLVLVATWARTSTFMGAVMTGLRYPWATGERATALAALCAAGFSEGFVNSPSFSPTMMAVDPLFPAHPEGMATVAEQWEADLAHDTLDRLWAITAPTLVIAGDGDLLTPLSEGQKVAAAIPGARLHVFTGPGSSHAAIIERGPEFLGVALGFLADLPVPVGG